MVRTTQHHECVHGLYSYGTCENQASLSPFGRTEISLRIQCTLRHRRYHLTHTHTNTHTSTRHLAPSLLSSPLLHPPSTTHRPPTHPQHVIQDLCKRQSRQPRQRDAQRPPSVSAGGSRFSSAFSRLVAKSDQQFIANREAFFFENDTTEGGGKEVRVRVVYCVVCCM